MSDKVIEKLYYGFLLLLPLVFSSTIIDPVLIPRQIGLTAFLFFLVIILILHKREWQFNFKTPIFYAIGSFLLLNCMAAFQADVVSESHAVLSKLTLLFSFFLITTFLLYNNTIRLNQLVLAVVGFGLITLCFSFFDIIDKTLKGQHLLRQIEGVKGTEANKNLLSSILFLCLPFYFMALNQAKWIRFVAYFAILSSLLTLGIIRTRVAFIACFIFFALLICYKIKERFNIKKRYFLIAGLVIICLSTITFLSFSENKIENQNPSSQSATEKYFSRLSDSRTLESRISIWKNSIPMSQENPFFGVGPGNWQIQIPKYGLNNLSEYGIANGETTFQRPHNDFLWILCETGILGLLSYLMIFGVIFYQLFFLIKKTPNQNDKWKFVYISSALIGYMVIAFFDFPYERIEHQTILMLLLAIVVSSYMRLDSLTTKNFKWLPFLLIIVTGYSFIVSINRYKGEQHAVKMYLAKKEKNWSETIYEAKKADNYFYRLDNTTMPLSWYEGIGHFNEGRMQESENCFYKAYQLTPYNIQVINNLASTYQVNGKMDEAVGLYNDALKISSNFDEAKLNLAALYFNKKEFDKAYSLINEIKTDSKNPKYKAYLVPILNQKINAYLKTATDKTVIDNLVKNVTTKEALLQLFFDAKKNKVDFENYLAQAKF